ncbi:unnamed protein product [Lactuca saligna]|uniref:Uncharacterized protein n=1 Tax=Lactuca saligna TaxID=75948 RepID=A0AA35Y9P2_LACSI|nr:unnamed protein product [Lactuca saligna]
MSDLRRSRGPEEPPESDVPSSTMVVLSQLRFPRKFYEEMGKLQVISYDNMEYPLLSSSLECCTNLRVLCLHECSLAFDFSSIGNLLNLEVLSFASCDGLHIDNGVFKILIGLEEIYAYHSDSYLGTVSFTGDDCKEVAERWKNLSILGFQFLENGAQWKNLSFENLEQFEISVGCSLHREYFK